MHRLVFCQKIIFSLIGEKIVEKFPHIFHFQKWKFVQNRTFWGKQLSRLAFFGGKLQKFANLGVKI